MICTADNCVRRFLVYKHVGEGEDKMAAKTVIRPAAEADIPAILALYRQLDSALVAMQPEFFCEGRGRRTRSARPSVPTTRISCWRSAAAQLSALR